VRGIRRTVHPAPERRIEREDGMNRASIVVAGILLSVLSIFHGPCAAGCALAADGADSRSPAVRCSVVSRSPYLGAILVDAATGRVILEENADALGYPASIVKLMNLLIILEMVKSGALDLQDMIPVTAAAATIGGSQVYLKENESFSVDDLLYAMIIQSANDAAVALALHVAGTKEAFVDLMNRRARELGMSNTTFHSVHGLPPGSGQKPDVSTARDIAKLCVELLKHAKTLDYTSQRERVLRAESENPFIMRTHNHLLGTFDGCDGLKTGYFSKAGYSIAATASRKGARAIAVVFGSKEGKVRDAKTRELLSRGLVEILGSPTTGAGVAAAGRGGGAANPTADLAAVEGTGDERYLGEENEDAAAEENGAEEAYDDMIHIPKKHVWIAGIVVLAVCVPAVFIRIKNRRRRRQRYV
jgi:D-alanyl-D-alanine carboxypeptidase (penicillin-binding protein 5/6)